MKYLQILAAIGLFGASYVAKADDWDKSTILKIDHPMAISDKVLQPGEYVMMLNTVNSERHIVQIFDKDHKHLVTTVLAIPNERLQPTGKSAFMFWEVPAGQPAALRAWFYPGDNMGQEFLYPKEKASQISAANNNANVPTLKENETAPETKAAAPQAARQEPPTAQSNNEPAPAPEQQQPTQVAQAAPAPEPQNQVNNPQPQPAPAATPQQPETLPKTGSEIPLVVFIGLASIAAAFALRTATRRV